MFLIVSHLTNQGQTNSKLSSMFGGTQDKCVACKKTVYPIEKVKQLNIYKQAVNHVVIFYHHWILRRTRNVSRLSSKLLKKEWCFVGGS